MKKLLCFVLVLLLLAGCGEPAQTDATTTQPAPTVPTATLGGQQITFEPWEGEGLPSSGSYYLTADVELAAMVTVEGDLKLHLNDHHIIAKSGEVIGNLFYIPAGATMTVYDDAFGADFIPEFDPEERENMGEVPGGSINSNRSFSGHMSVSSMFRVGGQLEIAGGHIDASQMNIEDRANGMVAFVEKGGQLLISGGVVTGGTAWSFLEELGEPIDPNDTPADPTDPTATTEPTEVTEPTEPVEQQSSTQAALGFGCGGAVYVANGGTCTVSGGVIRNGSASKGGNFFVQGNEYGSGLLKITGGTLLLGEATGTGGNICADGRVEISGGSLQYGRSYGHGGNIFLSGQLTATGGTLLAGACDANAIANKRGGNLAVNGLNASVNISGMQILDGTAACKETHGGNIGVFGYGAVEFTVADTVITGGLGHRGGNIYIGHFQKDVPEENMDYLFERCTMGNGSTTYRGSNMCCDTKDKTRRILVTFTDCTTTVEEAGELNLAIGAGAKDESQCDVIINGGSWSDGGLNIYGQSTITANGVTFNNCDAGGTGIFTNNP